MREAGERLRTSILLKKFFQRLLGEAKHLSADRCAFVVVGEELLVILWHKDQELKTIKLKSSWFPLLSEWLSERSAEWLEAPASQPAVAKSEGFPTLLVLEEDLVSFRTVLRDQELALEIEGIAFRPRTVGLERLGLSEFGQHALAEIAECCAGTVIVGGLNDYDTRCSLASILTLYGWHYIGDLHTTDLRQVLPMIAAQNLVVTTLTAADAWEALKILQQLGVDIAAINLNAILIQTFLPRLCVNCASEQQWGAEQLALLHPLLRDIEPARGRSSSGCQSCQNGGVLGQIGVQSILAPKKEFLRAIGALEETAVMTELFQFGLRPLVVDGLKKAQLGLISLESVTSLCPPLSADFQRLYTTGRREKNGQSVAAMVTPVDGSFASPKSETSNSQVLPETQGSVQPDGPLFLVGRSGKVRSKPLLLVVEDDLDQRQILELVFEAAGFEVVTAEDGQQAWHRIEAEIPDLIVTDLMMPVVDGLTFLGQLKSDPRFRAVPVLVLTVVSDVDKEYELLAAGADDYCEKSVQRKILLKRIENLLRRSGVAMPQVNK